MVEHEDLIYASACQLRQAESEICSCEICSNKHEK